MPPGRRKEVAQGLPSCQQYGGLRGGGKVEYGKVREWDGSVMWRADPAVAAQEIDIGLLQGDGSGLRGVKGLLLGRVDYAPSSAAGSVWRRPRVLLEDEDVLARATGHTAAKCPPYSGMMLAAIPNVTVSTDGVVCVWEPGGGRVLTNALRVWNMSGSVLGERLCRNMPKAGDGGRGESGRNVAVRGKALFMLRKFGYQWAHLIFDNVARLSFTYHVLAEQVPEDLYVIVDELTAHSAHCMEVFRAFLGPGAHSRLAVLPHCAVHEDAFANAARDAGSVAAVECIGYVHADSLLLAEPIGARYPGDGTRVCAGMAHTGVCGNGAGAERRWWHGAGAAVGKEVEGGATAEHGCWPAHAMSLLSRALASHVSFRRFGRHLPLPWKRSQGKLMQAGSRRPAGRGTARRSLFASAVRDCGGMDGEPWLYDMTVGDKMEMTGTTAGEALGPGERGACYSLYGSMYQGEMYDWISESGCAAKAGSPFAVLLLRGTKESCSSRDRCVVTVLPRRASSHAQMIDMPAKASVKCPCSIRLPMSCLAVYCVSGVPNLRRSCASDKTRKKILFNRRERRQANSYELAHVLTWAARVVLTTHPRAADGLGGMPDARPDGMDDFDLDSDDSDMFHGMRAGVDVVNLEVRVGEREMRCNCSRGQDHLWGRLRI